MRKTLSVISRESKTPELSPAEKAFVEGSTVAVIQAPAESIATGDAPGSAVAKPFAAEANEALEKEVSPAKKGRKHLSQEEQTGSRPVLITDTFRLEESLFNRLMLASAARKTKRLRPYTKQDIANQALEDWLKEHGY